MPTDAYWPDGWSLIDRSPCLHFFEKGRSLCERFLIRLSDIGEIELLRRCWGGDLWQLRPYGIQLADQKCDETIRRCRRCEAAIDFKMSF